MTLEGRQRWVIAVGGNALADSHDPRDLSRQQQRASELAGPIAGVLTNGAQLAIVHGNGPQVGARLIESETTPANLPRKTLHTLVAETQGEIGHYLSLALMEELRRRKVDRSVVTLLTHVLVDPAAPAFALPNKPVGTTYSRDVARNLEEEHGWRFVELPAGGWRRVVPSPRPLAVLQEGAVMHLVDADYCVIAGGGGGVPVAITDAGLIGVDAVVDKDYVAAMLAVALVAKRLIVLTDVPGAALSFGKTRQRFLERMPAAAARLHLARGEFAPGSMAPKVEACVEFVEAGGEEAVIAALEDAAAAFAGTAGTHIVP